MWLFRLEIVYQHRKVSVVKTIVFNCIYIYIYIYPVGVTLSGSEIQRVDIATRQISILIDKFNFKSNI